MRDHLLFRFMIDKRFQGLGYFKPTMDAVIDFVRTEPAGKATSLWLSYEPENNQARSCYLHYGFKETGEVIENEIVAIYIQITSRIKEQNILFMINYKL